MKLQYFEGNGRGLLGSAHLAQRLRAPEASVVLCNPFGEEAARAHRAYRVLADKLQEAGFSTLRFDYSGTGDSSGDAADCRVDRWLEDIEAAARELQAQTGSKRTVLVGLRFGATLAALCAMRRRLRIMHLVVWDPVVRGSPYLRELADMHRKYMDEELGLQWRHSSPQDPDARPTEALGMPISRALAADIEGIDIADSMPADSMPDVPHITLVSTRNTVEEARLRSAWATCPAWSPIDVNEGTSWNSDAALNSALVPAKEIAAIVSRIRECSPHSRGAD